MKKEFFDWLSSIKNGFAIAGICLLAPFAAASIAALAVVFTPMIIVLGFTGILAGVGKDVHPKN